MTNEDGRGRVGASKRRKTILMEMEKQMFAGPVWDNETQKGLWSLCPAEFLPLSKPVFLVNSSGESFIPGVGPLSELFKQLKWSQK